jgi:ribosomal protein L10
MYNDSMAKTPKRPRDPNQLAKFIMDVATGERFDDTPQKTSAAKLGGKGGKARAQSLTPAQRKEIAEIAAAARWKKSDD